MDYAVVQHHGAFVTVLASEPRPLRQAITAVREEYGWTIDFEDPPYYSNYDLVDDTAPEWRATHPGAKGVKRVAGGSFQTDYPERANTATSFPEEEKVLNKIVSAYNLSGNPGKFTVRKEGEGRYAIIGEYIKDDVGQDQRVSSILDTPISMPNDTRSASEAVDFILKELSVKRGIKIFYSRFGNNLLGQTQVTIGGENVPARNLLLQALASTKRPLVMELLFDPDSSAYFTNLSVATLAIYDTSGRKISVPIDRLRH
jgi:hypothetical protein